MAFKKDDILWKGILEEMMDEFLRFMHPLLADDIFDFEKGIEFLDKELEQLSPPEDDEFNAMLVDKLARLFTKSGQEKWILIHVEVQGQYRRDFNKRMFDYYTRIRDKYGKPVIAYAILTDSVTKERQGFYIEDFMGTTIRYQFNTCQIALLKDEELLRSNNLFALAALVSKTAFIGKGAKSEEDPDKLLLKLKLDLARELLTKQIAKEKIRVLMIFLHRYVNFENRENKVIFEKEIEVLTDKNITMGLEELLLDRAKKEGKAEGIGIGEEKGIKIGEEKGKTETKTEVVKNLIVNYGFSNEQISDMVKVTLEFVEKIRQEINGE